LRPASACRKGAAAWAQCLPANIPHLPGFISPTHFPPPLSTNIMGRPTRPVASRLATGRGSSSLVGTTAPDVRANGVQRTLGDDISYVLSRWPAECQPTHGEPLGSAGGLSGARFWRLTTPRGRLVLRRWPLEHPSEDALRWIHAVVNHAAQHGLAILPVPAMTSDGGSFVRHAGHLWELAPWLPGLADYEPQRRPAKLRAALAALAQFHVATGDFSEKGKGGGRKAERRHGQSPGIARRLARLRELDSAGIGRLSRAIGGPVR
jgi:hypothetical protein